MQSQMQRRIAITAIKTSVTHNINVRGVRPASVIVYECMFECIRVCLRACVCARHLNKPILIGGKRARSAFCSCGQKSAVCYMFVCVCVRAWVCLHSVQLYACASASMFLCVTVCRPMLVIGCCYLVLNFEAWVRFFFFRLHILRLSTFQSQSQSHKTCFVI